MSRVRPFWLVLALAAPAWAQEAAAPPAITGPDSAAFGIEFGVSGVKASRGSSWSVMPQVPGLVVRPVKSERKVIVWGPPGEYPKALDEAPVEEQIVTKTFTLTGAGPGPGPVPPTPIPPGPGPGPTPPVPPVPPVPDPNPMPGVTGLHMLLVAESSKMSEYPSAQVASWQSKAVHDYLASKGAGKNWRIWDKDTNVADAEPKWQAAMARAKGKPLPWLIISNGTTGYEGPAPADTAALLDLLKRYGEK
jgi:hypothetical protein